jgi:hypothetical protein
MKSTPTAAMEVLLNLTPLDLLIMAEARMALYKLHTLEQPVVSETETGLLSGKLCVTLFLICGPTTLFQFTTIPEPSRSL